ncbi:TPA: hypothetical protein N0F65_006423 [Lagenidium giganteum]|uniref:DDE Tnp4 domain-containing protein n=1 Tax=Lagenidium giganteum TaxID=4803 RepID=A0AAV2Z385_9STRA|nr:TPA: hypothetical protein N0F65_006423 [Lagenidium giganteum]
MKPKQRKRRAALCAVTLLLASARDRHYLTRSSLDTPSASAWTALTNSKCDQSLINVTGLSRASFNAHLTELCSGNDYVAVARAAADVVSLGGAKGATYPYNLGFRDEKNFQVQEPSSSDLQNAYYNGWLHSVLVTGTLCFDADGTIVWAKHNCPGSWNDGDISLEFCHSLLDVTKCPNQALGVVSDSVFPCSKSLCGITLSSSDPHLGKRLCGLFNHWHHCFFDTGNTLPLVTCYCGQVKFCNGCYTFGLTSSDVRASCDALFLVGFFTVILPLTLSTAFARLPQLVA